LVSDDSMATIAIFIAVSYWSLLLESLTGALASGAIFQASSSLYLQGLLGP